MNERRHGRLRICNGRLSPPRAFRRVHFRFIICLRGEQHSPPSHYHPCANLWRQNSRACGRGGVRGGGCAG